MKVLDGVMIVAAGLFVIMLLFVVCDEAEAQRRFISREVVTFPVERTINPSSFGCVVPVHRDSVDMVTSEANCRNATPPVTGMQVVPPGVDYIFTNLSVVRHTDAINTAGNQENCDFLFAYRDAADFGLDTWNEASGILRYHPSNPIIAVAGRTRSQFIGGPTGIRLNDGDQFAISLFPQAGGGACDKLQNVALTVTYWSIPAGQSFTPSPTSGRPILLIGDSVTNGIQSFPASEVSMIDFMRLQLGPFSKISMRACNGTTSEHWNPLTIPPFVLCGGEDYSLPDHAGSIYNALIQPQIQAYGGSDTLVIINLGVNDIAQGISRSQYRGSMRSIVSAIRDDCPGCTVQLDSASHSAGLDATDQALGDSYRDVLINDIAGTAPWSDYTYFGADLWTLTVDSDFVPGDGVHPNEDGTENIARYKADAILAGPW